MLVKDTFYVRVLICGFKKRNCGLGVLFVPIFMFKFVVFECKYDFINILKGVLYEKRSFNVNGDVCHSVRLYELL